MNKLFQQLQPSISPQSNNLSGIRQMMKTVQAASNPKQALQTAIANNPQMRQVVELVQKSGGDPRAAFYNLAKEKGVNPEDVLKSLK